MTPHPRSKRSIALALLRALLLAPVYALPFALFFGTLYGLGPSGYLGAFRLSLVFSTTIGLAMWAVRWFVVPRLSQEQASPDGRRGWTHAAAFSGAAILASYVAAVIVHFTVMPGFLGSARAVGISGMWTLLFVALFAGINSSIAFYRIAVARARAVERLRAELAEAEVRALRAQIQPHFLFNTLNSIAALVRSDPAAAEETITRLADVFRYALRASERSHARLAEELEFLRDYLAIEHVRFGDRLRVEERVDLGLQDVAVPMLLLQPIVENAVKHGISTRAEGGLVSLEVRDAGDRVIVEIADNGPGMNGAAPSGEGFGLHSVRERMRAAGPPHELVIESSPTQGTRVRLTLPKTPAASLPRSTTVSLPQTPPASVPKTPTASEPKTPTSPPPRTQRPTHPGATP